MTAIDDLRKPNESPVNELHENEIRISPSDLRLFSQCNRRVWLDKYGDKDEYRQPPVSQRRRLDAGVAHETEIVEASFGQFEQTVVTTWKDAVKLTRKFMQHGKVMMRGAAFEQRIDLPEIGTPIRVMGMVDLLLVSRAPNAEPVYVVVEIKRYTELVERDELQLDWYMWLVAMEKTSGKVGGEFWLGTTLEGKPQKRVQRYQPNIKRLIERITALAQVLDDPKTVPTPVIARHCENCGWLGSCRKHISGEMEISALPLVREESRKALNSRGIKTVKDLSQLSVEDLQTVPGIKSTAPRVRSKAHALVERRPVWFGAIPPELETIEVTFDIETDLGGKSVWSIGWMIHDSAPQIVLVGDEPHDFTLPDGQIIRFVNSQNELWGAFLDDIAGIRGMVGHWTHHEQTMLRKTAPATIYDVLSPRLHDVNKSVKNIVAFPTVGTGLKEVAAYLGYPFSTEIQGRDAAYEYYQWQQRRDLGVLANVCRYQIDDVQALAHVWSWVMNNRPPLG